MHLEDVDIHRPDDVRVSVCGREIDMDVVIDGVVRKRPMPDHLVTDQFDEVDCYACFAAALDRWPSATLP